MEEAGVPLVPGYHGEAQDAEISAGKPEGSATRCCSGAAAGGGGKGMKVVEHEAELAEALPPPSARPRPPSATRGCWWRNTC
ncbi:hypothetical protein P4129_02630 [Pseudomonas aeruginosa]|nr:hypothetical protein [Pseudomonas aeruginosa]